MRARDSRHRRAAAVAAWCAVGAVVLFLPSLPALPMGGAGASSLPVPGVGTNATRQSAPASSNLSNGHHWIQVGADGPLAVAFGAATSYDPVLGGVLAFGGYAESGASPGPENSSWLFRGGQWTEFCDGVHFNASCPSSPSARYDSLLTYDAQTGEMLLIGGLGPVGSYDSWLSDTWVLRNQSWSRVQCRVGCLTAPALTSGSLVDDPVGGFVYLALPGGTGGSSSYEYENGSWSTAPALPSASDVVYFDSAAGALRAASPTSSGHTYTLGSSGWVRGSAATSPIAKNFSTLLGATFDPVTDTELAFLDVYDAQYRSTGELLALGGGNWSALSSQVVGQLPYDPAGPNGSQFAMFTFDSAIETSVAVVENLSYTSTDAETTWLLTDPLAISLVPTVPATDVGVPMEWHIAVQGGYGTVASTFAGDSVTACAGTPDPLTEGCVYSTTGTYSMDATLTDSIGDGALASGEIAVNADPVAIGTSTRAATTVGVPVSFLGQWRNGTAPFATSWYFGDGSVSTVAGTSHVYTTPGTYSATWTVQDGVGKSARCPVSIVVNPILAVTARAARIVVDAGVADAFQTSIVGGTYPDRVTWSFGDGGTSTGPNVSYSYQAAGEYVASVNVTDYVGVVSSDHVYVAVDPALVTAAGTNESQVATGTPVQFVAGAAGGTAPYSYRWTIGDGGWGTTARFQHVFTIPGTYGVSVWVNDSGGGAQLDLFQVQVVPGPEPAPPSVGVPPPSSSGPSTGGPPVVVFPRLSQSAGAAGPVPLGNAIVVAGIVGVLIVAVSSAWERTRPGRVTHRRARWSRRRRTAE